MSFNQGRLQRKAARPVKIGNFVLGEEIGKGTFASVRLAHDEKSGEQYAVKVIDRRRLDSKVYEQQVRRESKILQTLDHPNIVRVQRILKSRTCTYMFLEYVKGGELYQQIIDNIHLEEDMARRYFRQLTSALAYAHDKQIMHRDIKPENILLDESKENIKIADFGMGWCRDDNTPSNSDGSSELMKTPCGTPKYMPPELLCDQQEGYDAKKLDVWSCGMVLYACLAGYLPYTGDSGDTDTILEQIQVRDSLKVPEWISAGARDVLEQALEKDARKRIDMRGLHDHDWTQAEPEVEEPALRKIQKGKKGVPAIRLDGEFGVRALDFEFGSPVTPGMDEDEWGG